MTSFDCIDFQRLSQIVASLNRGSPEDKPPLDADRKRHCLVDNVLGVTRNLYCLSVLTDEEDHPWENEDESGRRFCEYWRTIFQARVEGPRCHQHEDILRYVQQALDDIRWTIDHAEFDDLLALKKDSAPGPDGIPCGAYRCTGGLGSKFLFHAKRAFLEGGAFPDCFAQRFDLQT